MMDMENVSEDSVPETSVGPNEDETMGEEASGVCHETVVSEQTEDNVAVLIDSGMLMVAENSGLLNFQLLEDFEKETIEPEEKKTDIILKEENVTFKKPILLYKDGKIVQGHLCCYKVENEDVNEKNENAKEENVGKVTLPEVPPEIPPEIPSTSGQRNDLDRMIRKRHQLPLNFNVNSFHAYNEHDGKIFQRILTERDEPNEFTSANVKALQCSIMKLPRYPHYWMVQTNRYIQPIISNPYIMGAVVCVNALGDMHALGIPRADHHYLTITLDRKWKMAYKTDILQIMIAAYKDYAQSEVHYKFYDSQQEMQIGTILTAVCTENEIIMRKGNRIQESDVLLLTKPLGTEIGLYLKEPHEIPNQFKRLRSGMDEEEIKVLYKQALQNILRSNKLGASLMHKYSARCAMHLSGKSLFECAREMIECQTGNIKLTINNLPMSSLLYNYAKRYTGVNLIRGHCSELSGGLLIVVSKDVAGQFIEEFKALSGENAWAIGTIGAGDRTVTIAKNPRIIDVPYEESENDIFNVE